MEVSSEQYISNSQMNEGSDETVEQDTVAKLQARIMELERELEKQKTIAEHGNELLKVMRGDNFNSDSLH